MPIYESEELSREELDKMRRRNRCKECGGKLVVLYDLSQHLAFLACADWQRSHHEGTEREASRYEKEGLASLTIEKRRETMEQEHGVEKTRALAKYMGGVAMTKAVATEIVNTMWGEAPMVEKAKVILLCEAYQLNPLMKHVYLVGYQRRVNGKVVVDGNNKPVLDWSIQMGIGATRLLAQRKHSYSYLDMTPRKATKTEIEKILGDTADPNCIYGFVWIKDTKTGAEAFGLRGIEKDANIKGREKGNTPLNMACIRAERLALDRQYPGEMPTDVELVDERYIDAEFKVVDILTQAGERLVDTNTGEIIDQPPAPEVKEHWCSEHNCQYDKKVRGSSVWYAHKLDDNSWCNEIKRKNGAQVKPGDKGEKSQQLKRDPATVLTLNDLFKACNEDFKLQPAEVCSELGVNSQNDISDTPADCYLIIAAAR